MTPDVPQPCSQAAVRRPSFDSPSPSTARNDARTVTEVVLPGVVEPDGLVVRTRPAGRPAHGQVAVAVEATGVSFAEQQMRRGKYYDQPPYPFVPGYDLVGTVTAAGPGTDAGLVGRRVGAMTKIGAWCTTAVSGRPAAARDSRPNPCRMS